jgi:hypothetical protein
MTSVIRTGSTTLSWSFSKGRLWPYGRGGSWNRDGVILFAPGIHDVIYRVADGGGQPVAVTKVKKEGAYSGGRWPYFLPDGRHFLCLGIEGDDPKGEVYAAALAEGAIRMKIVSH